MRPIVDQAPVAATLDYDCTLIGALELSSKKWVFAVQVPGSRKHTKYTVEPNGPALVALLETIKARSVTASKPVARVVVTHEAGRDGFWLARFLIRRGVDVHVMQASSLPVDRRAAGEDGYDRRRDAAAHAAGVLRVEARAFRHDEPGLRQRHGLKIGTPIGAKSATLRVTTIMPWTSAIAAISASRSERGSGPCNRSHRRSALAPFAVAPWTVGANSSPHSFRRFGHGG